MWKVYVEGVSYSHCHLKYLCDKLGVCPPYPSGYSPACVAVAGLVLYSGLQFIREHSRKFMLCKTHRPQYKMAGKTNHKFTCIGASHSLGHSCCLHYAIRHYHTHGIMPVIKVGCFFSSLIRALGYQM